MRNTETNIGHRLMQKAASFGKSDIGLDRERLSRKVERVWKELTACCSLMSLHHDMWELFDELKVRE